MGVEHFLGRLGALVLGLIGTMIGFVVNVVASASGHVNDVTTHGGWGLLLVVVAFIGSLVAPFFPEAAAVLLVIATLGFIPVVHFGVILPGIFWLVAAFLAWIDRRTKYQAPTRV